MRRFETDRYGMISSFDLVYVMRRAEARRRIRERRERERRARAAARVSWFARLKASLTAPKRSTA